MTDTTPRKLSADPANPPGPRQTKRINKAAGRLLGLTHTVRQLSGVNVPGGWSEAFVTLMFGGGGPGNPTPRAIFERIAEEHGWIVSKANAGALATALEDAHAEAVESIPVQDDRRTPEEDAERVRIAAESAARYDAHREAVDAAQAAIMAKRPPNAAALIVAQLDEDDSDTMTDYHAHTVARSVAIGWRTGSREDFRQLRKAAAGFEPTAHLGPGCDVYTVRAYTAPDEGPNVYRESRQLMAYDVGQDSHGAARWTTEQDARDAVARLIAEAEAIPAPKALEWGDFAGRYGFDVHRESVEHRENYSMGSGNYLKAGFSDSTGWRVRSVPIGDGGRLSWCSDVLEDALGTAEQDSPEGREPVRSEGNGYTIQESTNKRGPFFLVVLDERTDRDTFETLRASARAWSGWYSRKWGKQPGGFGFSTREHAEDWASATFDAPEDPAHDVETPDEARLRELLTCPECGREHDIGDRNANGMVRCLSLSCGIAWEAFDEEPEDDDDAHPCEGCDIAGPEGCPVGADECPNDEGDDEPEDPDDGPGPGPCLFCGEHVTDQREASGSAVVDWATASGDFGCDASPETCREGVGSHARSEAEAERARTSDEAREAERMNAEQVPPGTEEPEGYDEHGRPYVMRYAVTHRNRDGMRTFAGPAQGRFTYATDEEARAQLRALKDNNTRERLAEVYPDPDSLAVRLCRCWPGHHDPLGVWFDDDAIDEAEDEAARNPAATAREYDARRLDELADKMQATIDDKRAPLTQNPTPRRLRIKDGQRAEADRLEETQRALRACAAALRSNTLPGELASYLNRSALYKALHDYTTSGPAMRRRELLRQLIDETTDEATREQDEQRKAADALRELEDGARFRNVPGFFPSPPAVVARVVELLDLDRPGLDILEPSAGLGHLAAPLLDYARESRHKGHGGSLTVCEWAHDLLDILRAKGYGNDDAGASFLRDGDFLEDSPRWTLLDDEPARFDRVAMNPPFEKRQDEKHVRAALALLRSGGRLVSVMSPRGAEAIRDEYRNVPGWSAVVEELPEGSFTGPGAFRTTGVRASLVIVRRLK